MKKSGDQMVGMKNRVLSMAALLSVLVFACLILGCRDGKKEKLVPGQLQVFSGNAQTCVAGGVCDDMLNVEVLSTQTKGAFGRLSKRKEVPNVKLRIVPLTPGSSAEPAEGVSDAGGNFRARLKCAPVFGDQYFRVECVDYPEVKPLMVHALSGVTITGNNQEVRAGKKLDEPITLTLTDGAGKPAAGVPVFFSLKSGNSKAKVVAEKSVTDKDGKISVSVVTHKGVTGKYEVLAEIGSDKNNIRAVVLTVMAIGWMNLTIAVLGGLAIFIFGMKMMSDGLQQIAGSRLKSLLQMFTSNNFNAMLAGLVVTALIQSSSATTVMVVGFINSALLNLTQGIGVILGAAIGTTVTAQMVSFNLDGLVMPAIFIGVALILFAKSDRIRGIASTILGFGLLFYGMMIMSAQLKGIASFPTFMSAFHAFDCAPEAGSSLPPFMAVLGAIFVGTLMTVIIQSSSATVGLAIAMADSGLLNFYTAVPLILGDNIGTTITGLLASLNASRTSRQAAVASLVFKVMGVVLVMPFLYIPWDGVPCFMKLVDVITAGEVFTEVPENLGRHLASAHTLFSIVSVAVFLPCIPLIAWLSRKIVPDKKEEDAESLALCKLEERLLNTPSAALSQVFSGLIAMVDEAMKLTRTSLDAVMGEDKVTRETVDGMESRIDATQHCIIDYLVVLTRKHLTESQSLAVPVFMHCVNDVERIGDRAINIFELLPVEEYENLKFSEEAVNELHVIRDELEMMKSVLLYGLRRHDMESIEKVLKLGENVKKMTARCENSHEARLRMEACTVEKGVVFVEILSNLERVSAHLMNVAERASEMMPHSVTFGKAADANTIAGA